MPKLKKATIRATRASAGKLFEEPEDVGLPTESVGARPLADRMRPRSLDEFVGQEKIVGPARALRRMIEEDRLQSIIL